MKKRPVWLVNFSLALLSAVLLALAFPNILTPSRGLPWFAPVALTPLLLALAREPRPLRRFLLGEVTGVVYWFGICYWIQFVLEYHGGMGRWGGWGTFLLFCVLKALHIALFSLLAAVVLDHPFAVPAVAALWTGIERTHAPFGFAWLALGNAGIDMPLPLRFAPFLGVYGLSFVFAIMAATVALLILRRGRKQLYWIAIVPCLLVFPDLPRRQEPSSTAVVVQPNLAETEQWTVESANQMRDQLIALTLQEALHSGTELLIWPEVPGPIYYYQDAKLRDEAANLTRYASAHFLLGTVAETPQGAPLNSAVLLRPNGELVDRYDKINLVPFGEYVPKLFGFVNRITHEAGDFAPGDRMVVFPMGNHHLGVFICYESAFPHQVRQFVRQGADLLVNISNDGYFGRSAAREQHLQIARMRAVENRRWLLRATNDGITAVIDPAGRVTERLPMYQRAIERMRYGYESGMTFYSNYGDWFAWGCLLAGAVALFCSQLPHYQRNRPSRAGSPAHPRP
jgi:apolipoprotein N-acyltransferase